MGKELAPLSSAKLGCGLCTDVTAVEVEGGALVVRKPIYAGKCFANFRSRKFPVAVSLRPNVFSAAPGGRARRGRDQEGRAGRICLRPEERGVDRGRGWRA